MLGTQTAGLLTEACHQHRECHSPGDWPYLKGIRSNQLVGYFFQENRQACACLKNHLRTQFELPNKNVASLTSIQTEKISKLFDTWGNSSMKPAASAAWRSHRPIHGVGLGCLEIHLKPNLGSCLNLCMSCRGMTPGDVLLNKSARKHDENIMKHVLSLIILWKKNSQSQPDPIEIHGFFAPSDSHISGAQVPLLRCFHEKVWGSAAPIPAVVSTKLDSSVEHLPQ